MRQVFCFLAVATLVAGCQVGSVAELPPQPAPPLPGSVSGTIVAARPGDASRHPVVGAHVEIIGTTLADTTDADGRFILRNVTQTSGTLLLREPPGTGRAP